VISTKHERVSIYLRDETQDGRLKLTDLKSEAILESITLSKIGDEYTITLGGGGGWGVKVHIL